MRIMRGGSPDVTGKVLESVSDPVDMDARLSGACGNDAKYLIEGYPGWVYDWQLDAA